MTEHGKGRKPFVVDSRDYPFQKLWSRIYDGLSVPFSWKPGSILNQGSTPHCVGFGTGESVNADDYRHILSGLSNADCHDLYYEANVVGTVWGEAWAMTQPAAPEPVPPEPPTPDPVPPTPVPPAPVPGWFDTLLDWLDGVLSFIAKLFK